MSVVTKGGTDLVPDLAQERSIRSIRVDNVPVGRLCGCRNVSELVPKVRRARFHKDSLPWRLIRPPVGGESVASSVGGDAVS